MSTEVVPESAPPAPRLEVDLPGPSVTVPRFRGRQRGHADAGIGDELKLAALRVTPVV